MVREISVKYCHSTLAMSYFLACTIQDHVIIELKQTGLKARSKVDEEELVREDDPFLVVHPNYVIDG